jgi:hypothetical protein
MDVRLPDGTILRGVPDGTTKADIIGKLQASGREVPAEWLPAAAPPKPATEREQMLSSGTMRFARGMKDPIDGAAQLASRIPGADSVNKAADAVGGFLNRQVFNRVGLKGDFAGEVLGIRGATPQQLDAEVTAAEQEYQQARKAAAPRTLSSLVAGEAPDPGFDGMRMLGNIASPANAAIARVLPVAGASVKARAAAGAGGGTLAALMQPVVDAGDNYAAKKAGQVGVGATLGALAAPVVGAMGDRVAQWAANRAASKTATRAPSTAEVEQIARRVANDTGQVWEDVSPQMQRQMQDQVASAMQAAGGRRDPAALARLRDFQAEGVQPTLGQLTRDGRQYAQEMNLRQVPGTGDPLLQRFQQQGQQLQEKVGAYGRGAVQDYQAGKSLMAPLNAYDAKLSHEVGQAYKAAKAAHGVDAQLPLQGLSQDVARIMDDFGDAVPSAIQNRLRRFGVLADQAGSDAPRRLYTPEEADKLIKLINQSGNATDKGTIAALTQLRAAVGKSLDEPFVAAPGLKPAAVEAFNSARKLAADRFRLHDAVPALEAAATGSTAPDVFVNRFITGARNTDEVVGLAKILRESPEAFQQARAQIGAKLGRAAFGENVVGDKAFAAERYATTLRELGDERLRAFFSAAELEQMHRLGRLGAYMNQAPNKSPVNSSGNWGAIMNVAARIPGVPAALGLARSAATAVQNSNGVQRSLTAELPVQPAQLNPATVARLSQLVTPAGVAAGTAGSSGVK